MKTKLFALAVLLLAVGNLSFGQGEVIFGNTSATRVSTNGPGGIGLTATNANAFYYGLFIAPVGTTNFSNFTFTGDYATNGALAGHFYGQDVPSGVTTLTVGASVVSGWAAGATMAYIICGWSSNLGHDWSAIFSQLAYGWTASGFFGQSPVGQAIAGGIAGGPLAAPPLMGPGQGVVLEMDNLPMALVVATPEPSAFALLSVGIMGLLWKRFARN